MLCCGCGLVCCVAIVVSPGCHAGGAGMVVGDMVTAAAAISVGKHMIRVMLHALFSRCY